MQDTFRKVCVNNAMPRTTVQVMKEKALKNQVISPLVCRTFKGNVSMMTGTHTFKTTTKPKVHQNDKVMIYCTFETNRVKRDGHMGAPSEIGYIVPALVLQTSLVGFLLWRQSQDRSDGTGRFCFFSSFGGLLSLL